jgi:hypothetical protein
MVKVRLTPYTVWRGVPDPLPLLGPGLAELRSGPAWRLLYLGVLASTVLSLLTPALTLVRPGLRRFRWLVSLFSGGAFIAFALASLWNGAWVLPADPRSGIEAVDLAIRINAGFKFGLGLTVMVTGFASVVAVAIGLWRELRRPAT